MPKVSVIIPAYGCAPYLEEAVASLRSQTFADWEAIIVDDGSPDNVVQIARRLADSDSRIKVYKTENRGVSAARNFAVGKSSGQYILPLDGDDIIAPSYIGKCMEIFDANPEVAVVYSRWEFFGDSTDTVDLRYYTYIHELVQNSIFNCAMFRREDFDRISGYDESMRDGLEDWEFWIRMLNGDNFGTKGERQVVQMNDILFFYRQKCRTHNPKAGEERLQKVLDYIYTKHADLYREKLGHPLLMAQRFANELQVYRQKEREKRLKSRVKKFLNPSRSSHRPRLEGRKGSDSKKA